MNKEGCDFVYYTKLVIAKHPSIIYHPSISIIHLSLSSIISIFYHLSILSGYVIKWAVGS